MNALRAPLTVFPDLKEDVCNFSLDRADDFIDGINVAFNSMVRSLCPIRSELAC
jgi:hypothetical protein